MKKLFSTFVNLSNHPSNQWDTTQISEALLSSEKIIDVPFPNISPYESTEKIENIAKKYLEEIVSKHSSNIKILCQGEMTFFYHFVRMANILNIPVVVACSERIVEETISQTGETIKKSVFKFVRFRGVN